MNFFKKEIYKKRHIEDIVMPCESCAYLESAIFNHGLDSSIIKFKPCGALANDPYITVVLPPSELINIGQCIDIQSLIVPPFIFINSYSTINCCPPP